MKMKIQLIKMCGDAEKVVLGGKFIVSNEYIRKKKDLKIICVWWVLCFVFLVFFLYSFLLLLSALK